MKLYTGMEQVESLTVLGCAPARILTIFFSKVKIFPLLEKLQQKNYSIFCNRMKVWIVNWFESVNVTNTDHQPGITCST
jgi:hypothetical protein